MTASHGRTGRKPFAWFAPTLGLFLAVSGGPSARAGHIHHHHWEKDHSESTSTSTPPMDHPRAIREFAEHLRDRAMPGTKADHPTSGMTHPAAEYLVSHAESTPTVHNWHHAEHARHTPPTPTSAVGPHWHHHHHPDHEASPMPSPSAISSLLPGSPTPAPEPSTILSALALVGVFAWRSRAARPPV